MTQQAWAVHPSFDVPRPVGSAGRGIEEQDMEEWFLALPEDRQDRLLRDRWRQVCESLLDAGASRVVAFPDDEGANPLLYELGFQPLSSRAVELEALPSTVFLVLMRLRDIPAINLEVYASDHLRAAVVDQSWDAMYVWADSCPAFDSCRERRLR